jgi:hypothetical protein
MKIVSQASAQSKPESVEEVVGQLQGFIRRAVETGGAAHEVERELFKRLLQLGYLLLQQFFALLGDGDEGDQVKLANGHTVKRLAQPQRRWYQSIFGCLELWRWVYTRGEKQRIEYAPLEARAELPAGKFSYLLQDWDQGLAVESPYGQVNTVLERMLGSGAMESAIRRGVNLRLKGAGIFWHKASAEAMLLLRAYYKAGRWNLLKKMAFSVPNQAMA